MIGRARSLPRRSFSSEQPIRDSRDEQQARKAPRLGGHPIRLAALVQRLRELQDLIDGGSLEHVIDRRESHPQIAVEDESRRHRDPAGFVRIEDAVCPHHFSRRVAKNRKLETHFRAHRSGPVAHIDRQHRDLGACVLEELVSLRIIRQLAEAERSPMAAVEDEYQRAGSCQFRQPSISTLAISDDRVRCNLADLWYGCRCHRLDYTTRALRVTKSRAVTRDGPPPRISLQLARATCRPRTRSSSCRCRRC